MYVVGYVVGSIEVIYFAGRLLTLVKVPDIHTFLFT